MYSVTSAYYHFGLTLVIIIFLRSISTKVRRHVTPTDNDNLAHRKPASTYCPVPTTYAMSPPPLVRISPLTASLQTAVIAAPLISASRVKEGVNSPAARSLTHGTTLAAPPLPT